MSHLRDVVSANSMASAAEWRERSSRVLVEFAGFFVSYIPQEVDVGGEHTTDLEAWLVEARVLTEPQLRSAREGFFAHREPA